MSQFSSKKPKPISFNITFAISSCQKHCCKGVLRETPVPQFIVHGLHNRT